MIRTSTLSLLFAVALAMPMRALAQEEIEAAPATAASAEDNLAGPRAVYTGAWTHRYGVLFSLNNIFTNSAVLSSFRGFGVGGQYHLTDTSAVRVGLSLSRFTDPVDVVKVTHQNGADEVTTYELQGTGNTTSMHYLSIGGDYLTRFGTDVLAPFAVGGARVSWRRDTTAYTDDVTVQEQTTQVDRGTQSFGLTLVGGLGLDWRLHERFSLYAEYDLSIDVASYASRHDRTTIERTSGGVRATEQWNRESSETRYLGASMGLAQGGSLGLIAYF